jgi:hypothetical protein
MGLRGEWRTGMYNPPDIRTQYNRFRAIADAIGASGGGTGVPVILENRDLFSRDELERLIPVIADMHPDRIGETVASVALAASIPYLISRDRRSHGVDASNPPRRRARNASWDAGQFIAALNRHADLWEPFARQYGLPMPLLKIRNVVGCGFYGCTFETTTPGVGFKITRAWDEASFFAWQQSAQTAGIVPAYAVVALPDQTTCYLIWRDLLDVCCDEASESLIKEGHLRPGYDDVLLRQRMDTSLAEQRANGIELIENYPGLGDIGHALINAAESGYVLFDLHPRNLGRWLDHNQLVIFDAGFKVKNEIYPTIYTLVKGAEGVELMPEVEWLERERKDENEE